MMNRISTSTLRLLLVVLLSTFISPSFAWQMIDSHADSSVAVSGHSHDEDMYHHHHHHDADGDEEDDNAHGQIGHLLSHLPAVMHEIASLPSSETSLSVFATCIVVLIFTTTDPPFKPPRNLLFA